jgi:outer membrane protein assembly factor BamB
MVIRNWLGVRACLGLAGCLISSWCWAADSDAGQATNWHQWRGPDATGTAQHGDPPTNWDEQTNVKWKVAIPGRGTSTPVVWGDRIFILTAIKTDRQSQAADETAAAEPAGRVRFAAASNGAAATTTNRDQATFRLVQLGDEPPAAEGRPERRGRGEGRGEGRGRGGFGRAEPPTNFYQFVVLAIDRNTGKTIWQQVANEAVPHEGHHSTGSFAAGSPVTDGQRVYATFGSYGIYCYDMDGNLQWQTDLGDMQTRNAFGEGSSPVLHGDTLVVNWDHEGESKIFALDARTGDVRWEKPRDERTTWNTPLITEYNGRTQVIANGSTRVRSYDLATGEIIWECGGQTDNPIPSPMRLGDMAICISGFRGYAAYAIPLGSTGDITDTDQPKWHLDKGTPYVSSAALVGDRLFFTKDRSGIMSCVNARSGEVIINQKRLPGLDDIYASPVAAAGRVYFTGRNGNTVVVDATADELTVLAENHLDDTIDASPAIVGPQMFIRGEKSLYCIAAE